MVSGEQPDQVDIIPCVQVKVWDRRRRQPVASLNSTYQVTAVQFSEDASQVVSAGIDNDIKIWDLRKNAVVTDIQVQSPG
jgi:Prp8 binding protein